MLTPPKLNLSILIFKLPVTSNTASATKSVITVRGYGKFKIGEEIGTTQKDRIKILVKKYIWFWGGLDENDFYGHYEQTI